MAGNLSPVLFQFFWHCIASFGEDQVQMLQEVPHDRLLIETDAPHLSGDSAVRPNPPAYIGEVADMVARHRRITLESLLQDTRVNTMRLYGPWTVRK